MAKPTPGRGAGQLDNRRLYVAPGRSAKGREGIDYVLGEEGVLAYVQALDRQLDSDSASDRHSPSDSSPQASTSACDASASDFCVSQESFLSPPTPAARAPITQTARSAAAQVPRPATALAVARSPRHPVAEAAEVPAAAQDAAQDPPATANPTTQAANSPAVPADQAASHPAGGAPHEGTAHAGSRSDVDGGAASEDVVFVETRQAEPRAMTRSLALRCPRATPPDSDAHANDSYHGNTSDDVTQVADETDPVVQRTLHEMFGSDVESDDDDRQESRRASTFTQLLADVQLQREGPARDDSDDDFEVDEAVGRASRIVPVLEEGDVNSLGPHEKLENYDSDREAPDDLQDEVGVQEDILDLASPADDFDAEMVTEGFLEAIGGSVRLAEGNLSKEAVRAMRWEPLATDFDVDMREYPELVATRGRPTEATRQTAKTPLLLSL